MSPGQPTKNRPPKTAAQTARQWRALRLKKWKARLLKPVSAGIRYSGIGFCKDILFPPKRRSKRPLGLLWLLVLYGSAYIVFTLLYRVEGYALQNRLNAIAAASGRQASANTSLALLPSLQNYRVWAEPEFLAPNWLVRMLYGKTQRHPDILRQTYALLRSAAGSGNPNHLSGIDLSGGFFQGADLSDTDLRMVTFNRADFTDAELSGSTFSGAVMKNAVLQRVLAVKSRFTEAVMTNADLRDARLFLSNFRQAYLKDAQLNGADLRAANLSGANLSGAKLINADLRGEIIGSAALVTDLSDAEVDAQTDFRGARFNRYTKLPFSDDEAVRKGMILDTDE